MPADLALGLVGNEPALAVNPFNPMNVAAAQFNNGAQTLKISTNGGATFPISRNAPLPAGYSFTGGDDSLAFDSQGRLFWTYLAFDFAFTKLSPIVQQVNPATGALVGSPVAADTSNNFDDKQWLAADHFAASPFKNNLYLAWTRFSGNLTEVFFTRSTNSGISWSAPVKLSQDSQDFVWPTDLDVAPNGDVYVGWHAHGGENGTTGEVIVRRSADGGANFGPELHPFTAGKADASLNDTDPHLPGLHAWMQGSLQPQIVPDPVRPGQIYVVSVDDPDNNYSTGDASDIVFSRSTDNGQTWSLPVTISHPPAVPANSYQIMPTAAIDEQGNLAVTWYDSRRNQKGVGPDQVAGNADDDFLLDLFATFSTDGGLTFTATDVRVNDVSNPFDPAKGPPPDRYGNDTLRIGEYNGLSGVGGKFFADWTGNGPFAEGQQIFFNTFNVTPQPTHFSVTTALTTLTAGQSTGVTVTALDALDIPVPTYTGTIHFTTTDPGASLPPDYTFAAADNGVHTFNVPPGATLITAGSQTITATDTVVGTLTGTSSPILVNPAAPAKLVFGQQPSTTVGFLVMTPPVTVRVLDTFGNLTASSANVTLTIGNNPGGATLGGTTTRPAAAGVATFNDLFLDKKGTGYTLTAAAGGLTDGTSTAFDIIAGPITHFGLSAPAVAIAGTPFSITVTALDANDLVVDGYRGTVVFSSTDPIASLPSLYTFTAADAGAHLFNNVILKTAGTQTITVRDLNITTLTGSDTIDVTPASTIRLVLGQQPTNTIAGQTVSPAVTVKFVDEFGNLITSDNTNTVQLSVNTGPAGGALFGTTTVTVSAGVATFTDVSLQIAGAYTLEAASPTAPASPPAVSNSFVISPAAPDHLLFNIQPTNAVAGQTISPAVTVRLFDVFGNLLAGDNADTVTLAVNSGPGGLGGTLTRTVSGGVATFNNLFVQTAGAYTLRAASGTQPAVAADVSASFSVTPAGPDHLGLTAQPVSTSAGHVLVPAVAVGVFDRFDNLVTAQNAGTASLGVANGPPLGGLFGTLTRPFVNGVAVFDDVSIRKAGAYTLRGTTSLTNITQTTSASFVVRPGPADHLGFDVGPSAVLAGQAINPAVVVSVFDAFGNLLTNDNSDTVTLSVNTGPAGGGLFGTLTGTVTGGSVSLNNVSLHKAGSYTLKAVSATQPGVPAAVSGSFLVSAAALDHVGFGVQPASVIAGQSFSPPVTVNFLDVFDNVLTGDNSDTATLTIASGPAGAVLFGTTTRPTFGGTATFNNLSIFQAGTYTLRAASGTQPGLASLVTGSFDVVAGSPISMTFDAQPTSTLAGQALAPGVTVRLFDVFNNLVTNNNSDTVTLAVNTGPAGSALGGTVTRTVSGGVATFDDLSLQKAGGYTLRANSATQPSVAPVGSASFTISPAAPAALSFGVQPSAVVAGQAISPAVTVQIVDAFGNLITTDNTDTVAVAINSGPAGATLSGMLTGTALGGVVSFNNLVLQKAGSYTLKAISPTQPALAQAVSALFAVNPAAPDHIEFGVQPSAAVAGQVVAPAVTVRFFDVFNNQVTTDNNDSITVSIQSGPTGSTLGGTVTRLANSGVVTFDNLSLQKAGTYTLKAISGSKPALAATFSTNFTIAPAAPATLGFGVQPGTTPAGQPISPAVAVRFFDVFGNLVTTDNTDTVTMSLASGPAGATLGGTLTKTAVTGTAAFGDLTLQKSGTYTLRATSPSLPGLAAVTSNSFTVTAGAPDHLVLGSQPGNLSAGRNVAPLTVRLFDAFGNLLDGDNTNTLTVAINTGPAGATLGGTLTHPLTAGVVTFNDLVLTKAGTYTLALSSFTLPQLPPIITNSFVVSPAGLDRLAFGVLPTGTVAGQVISPAVTVLFFDAFNNLVTTDNFDSATLTIASGPAGATLMGNVTGTATAGVVTFNNLVLQKAGSYTLRASSLSAPGLTPGVSPSFDIVPAAPASLAFGTQPGNVLAGQVLNPAVTVRVLDPFGNVVTQDNADTVTLALNTSPAGSSLLGTATRPVTGGIATFNDLSLQKAGSYSLRAASATQPGFGSLVSNSFTVAPAAASRFAVTGPATATTLTPVDVTVAAFDVFSNPATNYLGTVRFNSSDLQAVLPANFLFAASDQGTHVFPAAVTFNTAGNQTVTATDTLNAAVHGTTAPVAVSNPVPTTTSLSVQSVLEGSPAVDVIVTGTNFVNTAAAQINGAAVPSTLLSSTQLRLNINPVNAGNLAITVVNPGPGGGASNAQTFTVQDAPIVALGPVPVANGQGVVVNGAVVASFRDTGGAGPVSTYSAVIDWGDGSPLDPAAQIRFVSGNTFNVIGSHTYATPGRFPVRVTIQSQGGSTTASNTSAVIGSLSERTVAQIYLDLLGRRVDPAGLAFWSRLLDQGFSRGQLVQALQNTAEYKTKQINDLFRQYLHRDADPAGLAFSFQLLNNTALFVPGVTSLDLVRVNLLASAEYFQLHGGTNDGFLAAVYPDVLGRATDPAGAAFFGGLLAKGTSRAVVARSLLSTPDAKQVIVQGLYQTFLHHPADPGGLGFWTNFLLQGGREDQIIVALISSSEYVAGL